MSNNKNKTRKSVKWSKQRWDKFNQKKALQQGKQAEAQLAAAEAGAAKTIEPKQPPAIDQCWFENRLSELNNDLNNERFKSKIYHDLIIDMVKEP